MNAIRTTRLLGLIIFSGFSLLVMALPSGIVLALQAHYQLHDQWRWAIARGAAIGLAIAVVGGLLIGVGSLAHRRGAGRG